MLGRIRTFIGHYANECFQACLETTSLMSNRRPLPMHSPFYAASTHETCFNTIEIRWDVLESNQPSHPLSEGRITRCQHPSSQVYCASPHDLSSVEDSLVKLNSQWESNPQVKGLYATQTFQSRIERDSLVLNAPPRGYGLRCRTWEIEIVKVEECWFYVPVRELFPLLG